MHPNVLRIRYIQLSTAAEEVRHERAADVCCACHSPAQWHGVVLSTAVCLYRSFVTTELVSLYDEESARTLGVCAGWQTSRKNGLM